MSGEDFDLASLAVHLHLTPEQVRKMAERDKIPGRKVGGEWRFSAAEIHQWFEDRIGASDEKELSQVERVLQQQAAHDLVAEVDIPDMLPPQRIFVPSVARTKNSLIESICRLTADTGVLWDPEKMAEALHSREALHPTALENGVALLHPRRPIPGIIGEPFLSLAIQTAAIPFGGPRGTLTDIFFLIGSTDEALHLRVLARLSRLIQATDFLEQLRESNDSQSAWELIMSTDAQLT